MTADSLAELLAGRGLDIKRRSGEYWTHCPAHDDPTPSLCWSDGTDGIKLLCRAGCPTRAVLDAWALPWAVLFHDESGAGSAPAREPEPPARLPSARDLTAAMDRLTTDAAKLAQLAQWRGWTDADRLRAMGVGEASNGRIIFPTRDADGGLIGVTEYDPNPKRTGPKSVSTGRREMFPPPEFCPAGDLYVFEGEGDAVLAGILGLNAVGVPGATYWAGARGRAAASRLSDRPHVYFVPDCDAPGREWVTRAMEDCLALGVDARTLDLDPSNSSGYDLTDLVRDGGHESARRFVQKLAANSSPSKHEIPLSIPQTGWPQEMAAEAFYGLPRRIVEALDPVTESDRAAILIQYLVGFGNIVGRNPHMVLDGSRHGCSMYALIVGKSSKSRKGTSWARISEILESVDREWFESRVMTGVSSGEGLVYEIRDPVYERVRKDGKRDEDDEAEEIEDDDERYIKRVIDPGVDDKRLMLVETEFAQLLRVMRRDTNPLSAFIRNLWDRGIAGGLTKGSQTRTHNAHVSIVGHITMEELDREMKSVDLYNGFANRFLYVCATRSKRLPGGGQLDEATVTELSFETSLAIQSARESKQHTITFDADAYAIWEKAYNGELAIEHSGPYGAITARGEPMVARLAMIYALLDNKGIIRPVHMNAALAVWRYCDASARFLFAGETGVRDPVARTMLERIPAEGITRGELRHAMSHNLETSRFDEALRVLLSAGVIYVTTERNANGRAVDRIFLAKKG